MSLRSSYSLIAPLYDPLIRSATAALRQRSLQALSARPGESVLLAGIGTGLDIPYLPQGPVYRAFDLTPAMLKVAARRAKAHDISIELQEADAQRMPYDDASFDAVVLHLILAIVPDNAKVLQEASRVLKPGGQLLILDKFLKADENGWWKKALNPILRHIATRTDVVFENVHAQCPELQLLRDEPALANGWFRYIELKKT